MTTQEYISRNFGLPSNQHKYFASIAKDINGNIYSYGNHYPLLFKVGNKVFRNTAGYSNSTAKHINWAGGHGAIDVELQGCNQYTWNNQENSNKVPYLLNLAKYGMSKKLERALLKAVLNSLEAQKQQLEEDMASKKRKDTRIYAVMQEQLNRVNRNIELTRSK